MLQHGCHWRPEAGPRGTHLERTPPPGPPQLIYSVRRESVVEAKTAEAGGMPAFEEEGKTSWSPTGISWPYADSGHVIRAQPPLGQARPAFFFTSGGAVCAGYAQVP